MLIHVRLREWYTYVFEGIYTYFQ